MATPRDLAYPQQSEISATLPVATGVCWLMSISNVCPVELGKTTIATFNFCGSRKLLLENPKPFPMLTWYMYFRTEASFHLQILMRGHPVPLPDTALRG